MRKNRNFIVIFSLLVLLLIAACSGTQAPEETTSATPGVVNQSEEVLVADEPDEAQPTAQEAASPGQAQGDYADLPVGFTEEGFPYRGDPEAPVVLEEFSDYLCPFCGRHYNETLPTLLENYVAEGQVQYIFRDMPLVSLHPNAPIGHRAAICAGQQGADLYWQLHDQLFASQNQWASVPEPITYVTALAEDAGVEMDAFETCMADPQIETQINEGVAAGQALGFTGTPSFRFTSSESGESFTMIGAYPLATFTQWIDAILAGEAPPQEEQVETEPPELPFWANAEGLAPDPDRPGYTLAGDEYKGNPEASVVVVEFSDFQCPACQQHSLLVQPTLDQELVETGDILWVYKHLPLEMHPQSLVAAVAAECAADQGKFWEMHDLLFESADRWGIDEPEPELVALAGELDLDESQFETCLDSREPVERVVSDIYASLGAISSTPSFVVLADGQGSILSGSRPADEFVTLLQGVLENGLGGQ
ncbi:MAG: thioredoxin domain-containing protein [Anaerolineales bacterium]